MSKPQQQIQWTLLPNGVKDGALRFSVFVSIQLTNPSDSPGLTLSSYPDIANWPETLSRRIHFSLLFENGVPLPEPALKRLTHPPLHQFERLWNEIFAPDRTPLRPPRIVVTSDAAAATGIATYSSRRLLSTAQAQYPFASGFAQLTAVPAAKANNQFLRLAAENPQAPPIFAAIRGQIPRIPSAIQPALQPSPLPSDLFDPAPGYTAAEWHLGLVLFHLDGLRPPPPTAPPPVSAETLEEFQSKLATLSGYPDLMRRAGLVIDFEAPLSALGPIPPSGRVAIQPRWTPDPAVDASNPAPWTAYVFDPSDSLFEPRLRSGSRQAAYPVDGETFHGMLNLSLHDEDQPCFQLEQIDPLAEALKLNHFVRSNEPDPTKRDQLMTTPRPAGLSLLEECFADNFFKKVVLASRNQSSVASPQNDVTLWAEDLVRGYRPDIQTEDGKWHSLCRRVGIYKLRNGKEIRLEDEGWVSSSATSHGADPTLLLVSDTVLRWDGWSLAAPLPGSRIPSHDPPQPTPASPSLTVKFSPVRHSLPRLRFGWRYRMRVRLVDVAGNGLRLEDERASHWRAVLPEPRYEAYPYWRFEPLLAPDFIPRQDPDTAHGESVFKLVIRGDYNIHSTEVQDRHVAPPKCSELFAELHGEFDRKHSGPSPDWYSRLVKYDSSAPPLYAERRYHPPYLTDPLARAIVLHGVPGANGSPVILELAERHDAWPRIKPWRIHVEEDPNGPQEPGSAPPNYTAPKVDPEKGVLTVYLPKAEICTVRVNSRLVAEDLRLMGLWHWIERSFQEHTGIFRDLILRGDHWMFTPNREIQLVNAVASPLFPPEFKPLPPAPAPAPAAPGAPILLGVARAPASASADLAANVATPGRSASRLSMQAEWTEWLDDGLPSTQFTTVDRTAHAYDQPLDYVDATVLFPGRQDFGDTKHRFVSYTAVAATRFKEYLKDGVNPGSRASAPVRVHIPSSAAPPTPSLFYNVPILGWEPQVNAGPRVFKVRRGGGLRIYLNRPWYRSGADELLGVVVAAPGAPDVPQVSKWGRDPLKSTVGPGVLTEADFLGDIPHRITLPWANGAGNVTVLGHRVHYDVERNLWFADVIIDPHQSYFPFVQLALVRFQPYSLDNLYISPAVISDFAQLAPERAASLIVDPVGPGHTLRVRLSGKAVIPQNRAGVYVERARPGLDGSVQWETVNETPYPMTFNSASGQADYWECDEVPLPFGERSLQVRIEEEEVFSSNPDDPKRIVYVGRLAL